MAQFPEQQLPPEQDSPFGGRADGNIWGWRFSYFGLLLILLMLALMIYRHHALGVPFGGAAPEPEKTETPPQQ